MWQLGSHGFSRHELGTKTYDSLTLPRPKNSQPLEDGTTVQSTSVYLGKRESPSTNLRLDRVTPQPCKKEQTYLQLAKNEVVINPI
jgi:hypothetical protein